MKEFLQNRIKLINILKEVEEVNYADLVLIITAIISACASIKWPGTGIDERRFVELLVNFSPPDFRTSCISVPALISSGLLKESDTLYGEPGQSTRIFKDEEIDLSLSDTKLRYVAISEKKLRKHCYASLVYKWLRCGYSHEYCAYTNITQVPASHEEARVSYIGRTENDGIKRMVSFHIKYLINIADYHVSNLSKSKSPIPSNWWIDQG